MVRSGKGLRPPKQWYVERAALDPGRRPAALRAALEVLLGEIPAAGAALIHASGDGIKPWAAVYAGSRKREMGRWISARIEDSLETTAHALAGRAPCSAGRPLVSTLGTRSSGPGGLWVLWPRDGADLEDYRVTLEGFRAALEEFVEVEHREALYFREGTKGLDADLAKALRDGDEGALPALLTFGRMVGDADFAYWGVVHDDVVDVEWHQGAMDSGFGFELPLGQGVGGRAFAVGEILDIPDYRNCQYRYPGVSDVTDREGVRSTLAIPVRSDYPGTGAVLYAARRSVEPFTPAQRILLSRLARSIEPAPVLLPSSRWFFATGAGGLKSARSELRGILLRSHEPQDVEKWLERLARGTAILTDAGGRPYVLANAERLERLRAMQGGTDGKRGPRVVPLGDGESLGDPGRGHLNLWPSVDLPLEEWPDLLEDAAAVSNVVIDRREHAHDRLNKQRAYWLGEVKGGGSAAHLRREGNRLGLAVDRGEVWAFAWRPDGTTPTEQARPKMVSEDAVLDLLGSPPIFVDENVGVVLLEEARGRPSEVRDGLLRHLAPSPLWLVHGAVYDSFEALPGALSRAMDAVERMRREEDERYVVEIGDHGLDGLLENPKLRDELAAFAGNLLDPLLAYDAETGSCLTETFCLALTSGSAGEAAKDLFVHENTVRYRLRRAGEILGKDLSSPKERTALILAAFVWLRDRESPVTTAGA